MDLYGYIDRLEEHFDDPVELQRIIDDATADQALVDLDRQLVLERAGTYLADAQKAAGADLDVDTVGESETDWDDAGDE